MKYFNTRFFNALKNNFCIFILFFAFVGLSDGISQNCPDYHICFSVVSESDCCRTYEVHIEGDFSNYSNVEGMYTTFTTSGGGEITNITFIGGQMNYFEMNGATIDLNNNTVASLGSNMSPQMFTTRDFVYIEICGEPGESIILVNNNFRVFLDGIFCDTPGTCDGVISFQPPGSIISGTIVNAMTGCTNTVNNVIEGVDVNVSVSSGLTSTSVCSTTTDDNGIYSCTLCDSYPYDVCVESSCPNGCGLSNFGIAQITNHILYQTPFTLEQKIAADVNQDNKITGADIVLIRKELLGLSSIVTNWCRFVPVEDFIYNISLDGIGDNCVNLKSEDTDTDFIRVMLGDVLGHCTDCVHGDNMGDIPIVVKENEIGEYYYLSPTDEALNNFSLSIDLSDDVSLSDIVVESVFGEDLEYNIVDGVLRLIWFDVSNLSNGYKPFLNEELLSIKVNKRSSSLTLVDGCILTKSGISKLSEHKIKEDTDYKSIEVYELGNILVSKDSDKINISCYDINGRKVSSKMLNRNVDFVNFNLRNYPMGIYLFIIDDGVQTKTLKYLNY